MPLLGTTSARPTRLPSLLAACAAGVLAFAGLAGCTAGGTAGADSSASSNGADSGTLRLAYQSDISSFDPDNNFEVAGLGAILSVYQGLVQYEPGTTKVVGNLASSWDVSPDGLTYTFHLRDGVTFHDGTPMTSANVAASFTRRMLPANALSYFLAGVAEMKTPDPSTFVLDLTAPQIGLLDNLASPWGPKVVGPQALEEKKGSDDSASWLTENADGTGPYKLTTFSRGKQYKLTRNDAYWGTKAGLAAVEVAIVPDIGQQVLQAKSGQLDAVLHGYPFAQLDSLPDSLQAITYDDLGLEMAFINPSNHLTSAAQRQRVIAAINPATYVQDAFAGYATAATSLYPKAMAMPGDPYTWPGVEATKSAPVDSVQIAYTAGEAGVQQRVADLMISALSDAGIKASATVVPDGGVSGFTKDPASAPDILLAQNNPDSADPGSQADLFFAETGALNVFGYTNPAANGVLKQAGAATDPTARRSLYAQAAQLMFDDGGFMPIADVKDVIVAKKGITGETQPAVPWNLMLSSVRAS